MVVEYGEEIWSLLYDTQHSDEVNGVENAGKENFGVKDSKEAKEAEESALELDSGENKDVDQVKDDSKNIVVGSNLLAKHSRLLAVDDALT